MEWNSVSVAEQPEGGIGDELDAGRSDLASETNGLDETPHGSKAGGGRYGELQQVFTTVLLAIVSAYGVTSSVIFTVVAALLALLVTVVVSRKR